MKPIIDKQPLTKGFVALTSSIVISMVLVLVTTEALLLGYRTRFITLSAESKEVSVYLARSCAQYAIGRLLQNPQYLGDETIIFSTGTCNVAPLHIVTTEDESQITVGVHVTVDAIQTTHEYVYRLEGIHHGDPSLPMVAVIPDVPRVTLESWREVYSSELYTDM